jgi:hypothetical protein
LNTNTIKPETCNYGVYSELEELAEDRCEKGCCDMLGTKTYDYYGSTLMFCDEHYSKIAAKKQ